MLHFGGGMGSHKHGISGTSGPTPDAKLAMARDENRRREQALGIRRRQRNPMFASIRDLFRRVPREPEEPKP